MRIVVDEILRLTGRNVMPMRRMIQAVDALAGCFNDHDRAGSQFKQPGRFVGIKNLEAEVNEAAIRQDGNVLRLQLESEQGTLADSGSGGIE